MDKNKLLSDYTKTVAEIATILEISTATVVRWRKKAGIAGPRGSKKGVKKPLQMKRKTVHCAHCKSEFEVIVSSKKIYCSLSCAGKNHDKSYMQTEVYKKTLMKDTTPELRRYRNRVTKLSEKTYQKNKHILNPHGYNRTICGVPDGYQLDHIISVKECFERGFTPEEASKLENLQLLPWKTNLLKG